MDGGRSNVLVLVVPVVARGGGHAFPSRLGVLYRLWQNIENQNLRLTALFAEMYHLLGAASFVGVGFPQGWRLVQML